MTIDELAHALGVTTRNIRAYQARALLPPPRVRGRTGYYGPEHAARLHLIQDMQAEGFSLRSIRRLLESWNGATDDVLTFKRVVLAPFGEEEPEIIDGEELARRFGGQATERLVRKAERIGVIRYVGDGNYSVPSPRLLRIGEELVAMGIPLRHVLAVASRIFRSSQAIANAFIRLFIQDVMSIAGAEDGGTDWKAAREAAERVRPLAREAVMAAFEQTMARTVEREFSRIIES